MPARSILEWQNSDMSIITPSFCIRDDEVDITAIRAQGAGGQNVNKVSNAVHLRFDIRASSLDDALKARLLALNDDRITRDGVIVIKAQKYRSLEKNREDAMLRLQRLVNSIATPPRPRKPTRPTAGSQRKRLERKQLHGRLKASRGRVHES